MSMLDRAKNLKKKEYESWDAQEGSVIAGKIVSPLTTVTIKDEERYLARVLSEETGKETTVWCGKVLLDLFKEHNPQVSDEVAIKCFGKPEGKSYKLYEMEVERHTPHIPYAEPKQDDSPPANGKDSDELPDFTPPFK